jgi:deoxycytidine triphosphate deaminase
MAEATFEQRWKWIDPDPGKEKGILLSDRIRFYVNKVQLIKPFDPGSLRPASYNLHVGDLYLLNDKPHKPNRDGGIVIPRNGLIYVRLKEELNLPCYIVAQHDLRVKQVYRGFLAGRSLQIDPGYSGHINYPVYNFTDEDKMIYVGEAITSICFIKTTSFGSAEFWSKIGFDISEDEMKKVTVDGLDGYACLYFPESGDRSIPEYWLDYPGEKHRSSVERLQRSVNRMVRTWKKYRTIAFLGIAALLASLLGTLLGLHYWTSNNIISVNKDMSRVRSSVEQLQKELNQLKTITGARNPAEKTPTQADPNKLSDSGK